MNDFAVSFSDDFTHFSLISCSFPDFVLYLPYFALHFTLNVRISRKVLTSELIDRGENSEFSKSTKKIPTICVSSVRENSENVANGSTASDIEFVIFFVYYISVTRYGPTCSARAHLSHPWAQNIF